MSSVEGHQLKISHIKKQSLNHLPEPPEYTDSRPNHTLPESKFKRLVNIDSKLTKVQHEYPDSFDWYDPDDEVMNTPEVEIVNQTTAGNIAECTGTKIQIENTSTTYHRFVALAHEYGHVLLCHTERNISRVTEEVEAELVAYLFTTECGIPCPQSSAYIAKYIKRLENSEDSFNKINTSCVKTAVEHILKAYKTED
jgi:hypothetical protein